MSAPPNIFTFRKIYPMKIINCMVGHALYTRIFVISNWTAKQRKVLHFYTLDQVLWRQFHGESYSTGA